MVRYSDDIIEEIINSNDIVDVVSQYVTLKRSGRNFLGLCPFHKEKTPSFSVSPDKQIFHCFGCGVGGNVIHFVSKIESLNFKESLEMLADKAGITLPTIDTGEDSKRQELKEKIYKINEAVAELYHKTLYEPIAKPAQEYVKKRKLDNKTLVNFKIGYAPNQNILYKFLKEKGFNEEEILTSTLVKKYNNTYIDSFKNRLIFPILDVRNRVIAFGGRVLDNSLPKYINSPDTVVYNKGRNLYGLNVAKNSKLDKIIMVEGYMDCVSLHQRGIPNAVASLGTALTENQGRLLRKYSEKVVISYDSDGAGQAATLRGLEILKNIGCDVRILQMEGAKDPDEYVIKYGNGRFNLLVENAISLVEFKVKVLKKNLNLENANDKIKFLKETAKILQKIDSKIEQEIYIDKISKEYGISKEAIYAEINKQSVGKIGNKVLEKNRSVVAKKENNEVPAVLQKRENAIIALLINGDKAVYDQIKHRILPSDLKLDINKKIVGKVYNEYEKSGNIANNIIDLFTEDQEAVNKLTEVMADEYQQQIDKKTIDSIINIYEKEKLTLLKSEIIQKLKETEDSKAKQVLEQELNDIIIKLTKLK
ncbi:MAG: DNA primase [Clostridia bacterium]|nr:DNA primase [Clostridia bacterium]